jgi:nonribosomal peptide synthetase MxcG
VAESKDGAAHKATLAFFELRSGSSEPTFGLGPTRCERLTRALAGTGISCPPADRQLLFRYLDSCVEQGLLPAP